ncbi:MAG TPA: hypothetical protein VJK51_03870 [Candidatus Nanoarchaeia archaeon]|nr:hypothetical protein [Candidatus Nanoarchaeia archaeon]
MYTEREVEDLFRLSSLYDALCTSATAPVVVPSLFYQERITPISHIFYDCADDENDAKKIMSHRISIPPLKECIRGHLTIHNQIEIQFSTLDEALNTNNKNTFNHALNSICQHVTAYGVVVGALSRIAREDSFLFYPTSISGNYFTLDRYIRQKQWNPHQSLQGCFNELAHIEKMRNKFANTKLEGIELYERNPEEPSLTGTTLASKLALTIELLKRAGFPEEELETFQ